MADVIHTNQRGPVLLPLARRTRLLAFLRSVAMYCGSWLIVAPGVLAIGDLASGHVKGLLLLSGIILVVVGGFLWSRASTVIGMPLVVAAPVRGQWMAINSPASRVPSHGTHAFAQAYAIDLICSPNGRPDLLQVRGSFLPPEDFPSFAKPVFAVASGTVVRVHDRQRDHRSRSTKIALAYFALESFLRSLGPPSFLLGNYLILRVEDGSHVLYAHLRRGSLRVSPGDDVLTGDLIAECGNSGNSTMPHVHVQRQDVASVLSATGLPWAIAGVREANEASVKHMQRTRQKRHAPCGARAAPLLPCR